MRVIKERINLSDQSLRYLRFEVGSFGAGPHRHPQLELTWVEQGNGVRFMGDSAAPFGSGDLVLVGSDLPHAWISTRPEAQPLTSASVASVLQFSPALFEQHALPELQALQPLSQLARRGLKITGRTFDVVTRRMRALDKADGLGRLVGLLEILRELTLHREDLHPIASADQQLGREIGSTRRIDRLVQWMHTHLSESLSAQRAAKIAHVTPAAFSRFFRRETGRTFTHYVNEIRCAQACAMLRNSSAPIADIARDCGFRTSSHFNRQFLAHLQTTPRAYRQRSV